MNYLLYVTADLENLTNFQPLGGVNSRDFSCLLKLKCERCGRVAEKNTCLTLNKEVELPKRGSKAHCVRKCNFCAEIGTVVLTPGKGSPLTLYQSRMKQSAPLMLFECDGVVPIDFTFRGKWQAETILAEESEGYVQTEKIHYQGGREVTLDLKKPSSCWEFSADIRSWYRVCNIGYKFKATGLEPSKTSVVCVERINQKVTEKEVKSAFSEWGDVIDVKFDRSGKAFGAVALVAFLEKEDAANAVQNWQGQNGWVVQLCKGKRRARSGKEMDEASYSISPTKSCRSIQRDEQEKKRMGELLGGLRDVLGQYADFLRRVSERRARQVRSASTLAHHLTQGKVLLTEGNEVRALAKLHLKRCREFKDKMSDPESRNEAQDETSALSSDVDAFNERFEQVKKTSAFN